MTFRTKGERGDQCSFKLILPCISLNSTGDAYLMSINHVYDLMQLCAEDAADLVNQLTEIVVGQHRGVRLQDDV